MLHESTSFGFSSLLGAFSSPSISQSFARFQNFVPQAFLPPPYYFPPPPDPYLHLPEHPSPQPVVIGTSWSESAGTVLSFLSVTSIYLGIGALAGYASGCFHRPKEVRPVTTIEQSEPANQLNVPQAFHLGEILQLD